jgi:hypothetical protein
VRTRAIIITFCAAFAVRYSSSKNAPMVSRKWHRLAFASKITRSFSMAHAITALQRASRPSGAHWRIRNKRKFWKALLAAVAVFWPLCLPAQWLPTIKAVVGQPVLQELMGGYSMRCAFHWTTSALVSGKSPQIVCTLDDNDASTAWIDPNPTIGTKLQFQFPAKLPAELNGIPFYGLDFASGVIRPVEAFNSLLF